MVWRDIYSFGEEVQKIAQQTSVLFLGDDIDPGEKEKSIQLVEQCDQVIIALYPRIVIGRGNVALNNEQQAFLKYLFDQRLPSIIISFGSPYVISELWEAPTYICAYGNAKAVQAALAEALFNKKRLPGALPVTLSTPGQDDF